MIGKLLGHRQVQTTARYAHIARHSVRAVARRIEDSLAADLDVSPKFQPRCDSSRCMDWKLVTVGENLRMSAKLLHHFML